MSQTNSRKRCVVLTRLSKSIFFQEGPNAWKKRRGSAWFNVPRHSPMSSLTSGLEVMKPFTRLISTPKSLHASIKSLHTFGPRIKRYVCICNQSYKISLSRAEIVLVRLELGISKREHDIFAKSVQLVEAAQWNVSTSRKSRVVPRSCPEYFSQTQAIEECAVPKLVTQSNCVAYDVMIRSLSRELGMVTERTSRSGVGELPFSFRDFVQTKTSKDFRWEKSWCSLAWLSRQVKLECV